MERNIIILNNTHTQVDLTIDYFMEILRYLNTDPLLLYSSQYVAHILCDKTKYKYISMNKNFCKHFHIEYDMTRDTIWCSFNGIMIYIKFLHEINYLDYIGLYYVK